MTFLTDKEEDRRRLIALMVIVMLAGSVLCVAIAPMLMPSSYSVVENAISESAAQGVEGAWLARTGFLLLGFGVLLLAQISGEAWGAPGRLLHRVYGISMIGAAAFSHMPWEELPYDAFEDLLHSAAASAVGMAFTVGVFLVLFRRPSWSARAFDMIAILAALGISMTMFSVTDIAGAVQRVMFGIGYLWYGIEAVRLTRSRVELAAPRSDLVEIEVS